MEKDMSFLASLLKKKSFTIGVQEQTGNSTEAAQQEVDRQIGQISKSQNGDYITGEGVTKSGQEE
jgi:hypothetical protein